MGIFCYEISRSVTNPSSIVVWSLILRGRRKCMNPSATMESGRPDSFDTLIRKFRVSGNKCNLLNKIKWSPSYLTPSYSRSTKIWRSSKLAQNLCRRRVRQRIIMGVRKRSMGIRVPHRLLKHKSCSKQTLLPPPQLRAPEDYIPVQAMRVHCFSSVKL